jgi:hypothetical protein
VSSDSHTPAQRADAVLRAAEAAAAAAQAAAAAAQAASLPLPEPVAVSAPAEPVAPPGPAAPEAPLEPAVPEATPEPPAPPELPAPQEPPAGAAAVVAVEAAAMVQPAGPVARIGAVLPASGPVESPAPEAPPERAAAPYPTVPREPPIHEAGAAGRLLAAADELEAHVARAREQLDALEEALGRLERYDAPAD